MIDLHHGDSLDLFLIARIIFSTSPETNLWINKRIMIIKPSFSEIDFI